MGSDVVEVIRMYQDRSYECWDEANLLFQGGFSGGVVDRLYYSAFNMLQGLLILNDVKQSSHKQVSLKFSSLYIKTEIFPKEFLNVLRDVIRYKSNADYGLFGGIEKNKAGYLLMKVRYINRVLVEYINHKIAVG